jgi:hypothetical protein
MKPRTSVYILQFAEWWQFWEWRIFIRCPLEIRRLKGKQIPLLLWPEELP